MRSVLHTGYRSHRDGKLAFSSWTNLVLPWNSHHTLTNTCMWTGSLQPSCTTIVECILLVAAGHTRIQDVVPGVCVIVRTTRSSPTRAAVADANWRSTTVRRGTRGNHEHDHTSGTV